jgi:MOSC domain-containing protein YiiM
MSGRLKQIWTKRFHRGPMEPVSTARLQVGRGLANNADLGGKRQITLISRERWEIVTNAMDVVLDPILRRANLLVSGINLQESRNRVIRIGPCRIRLVGETRPCERMDLVHPGLCAALDSDWNGGAYGEVLDGGEITINDEVRWEQDRLHLDKKP